MCVLWLAGLLHFGTFFCTCFRNSHTHTMWYKTQSTHRKVQTYHGLLLTTNPRTATPPQSTNRTQLSITAPHLSQAMISNDQQ